MTTTHSTITDPEIHEPKGVAEAAANTVYRADGAGSGTWEAPLKLIERRALTGATSEEFTGLSQYRNLILVIESVTFGVYAGTEVLLCQLSTASTYRTSGYYNQFLNDVNDTTNYNTTGLVLGVLVGAAGYDDSFGIVEINNLNAAYPTSMLCSHVNGTVNRINSSSSATVSTQNHMGIYPTAEAHEKIKILTSTGNTMSDGYFTLYGI